MPDVLTTLTAAAVAIFRERQAHPYKDSHGGYFSPRDAVLRAARGESVRAYAISGIAGIKLPQSRRITTPWGILHPTPPVDPEPMMFMVHESRCLFVEPRLLSVRFDRAGTPQHDLDRGELDSR